ARNRAGKERARVEDAGRIGVRGDGALGALRALVQALPAAGGLVEREQAAERVHLVVGRQPAGDRLVTEGVALGLVEGAAREIRRGGVPLDQCQMVGIVESRSEPEPSPSG